MKTIEPKAKCNDSNDVCTRFAQDATDAVGVDAVVDPSGEWIQNDDDGDGAAAPASDVNPQKPLFTEDEQSDPMYIATEHGFVVDMLVYEKAVGQSAGIYKL